MLSRITASGPVAEPDGAVLLISTFYSVDGANIMVAMSKIMQINQ